jgi:hypothetical protein
MFARASPFGKPFQTPEVVKLSPIYCDGKPNAVHYGIRDRLLSRTTFEFWVIEMLINSTLHPIALMRSFISGEMGGNFDDINSSSSAIFVSIRFKVSDQFTEADRAIAITASKSIFAVTSR